MASKRRICLSPAQAKNLGIKIPRTLSRAEVLRTPEGRSYERAVNALRKEQSRKGGAACSVFGTLANTVDKRSSALIDKYGYEMAPKVASGFKKDTNKLIGQLTKVCNAEAKRKAQEDKRVTRASSLRGRR